MSIKSYYRRALLLPVLAPVLIVLPFGPLADSLPRSLNTLLVLLYWSLLVGGLPYLLFAAGFLVWQRGRSERQVHMGILLSPFFYTAGLVLCLALFLLAQGTLAHNLQEMGTMGMFGVAFGYAYVILAEAGRLLLRPRRGEPEPAVP